MKKALKKISGHIPLVGPKYHELKHLREVARQQTDRIIGLGESVERLEARNDEWAAEVRSLRNDDERFTVVWPVRKEDVIKAIPGKHKNISRTAITATRSTISWVIPPTGPLSGGHTTILRIIAGFEKRGYICRLYVYDPLESSSREEFIGLLDNFPKVGAEVFYNEYNIAACDALFATSWHTAYPVYNSNASKNKYYLVQDFEPFFDPVGSYSTLAENTYKFNLHGITLGAWMKDKLEAEYGMKCDNFDLAVTKNDYKYINKDDRKKVVFYARPVTPRRGFELGVLALEEFHRIYPDYEVHLIGWDLSRFDLSFDFVDHGIASISELNELYNECAAGLVLSFTNMSLLPLEMMASGCIPVVNKSEHTMKVGYSDFITYVEPNPAMIVEGLHKAIQKFESDKDFIDQMTKFTGNFSWDDLIDSIEKVLSETK